VGRANLSLYPFIACQKAATFCITTGGTSLTGYDGTPDALISLFDIIVDGFGELFRMVSWQNSHTSALRSRAVAGMANRTCLLVLPGSKGVAKEAYLISAQSPHGTL